MLPPLSLYIHLPWCVRKCPYCDFNSHRAGDNAPKKRYVAALKRDLAEEARHAGDRQIISIFLGGGTPSLFTPDEIADILATCRQILRIDQDCEITMEANPGTVERGSMSNYRSAGVTRLSLGAQSFDSHALNILGRIHGPDDIRLSFDEAVAAGFDSINVDLMFALPGQDLAAAMADVESVLVLNPPHVSYYQLTLEPNTVFYANPPANIPDDEQAFRMQEEGHRLLAGAGFTKYEISAFARPEHRCRHNLNYWSFGDYLAVGAGAHGKLSNQKGVVYRYQKPANPSMYMEWAEAEYVRPEMKTVSRHDKGFEFMLNALRLTDGFAEKDFVSRTGEDLSLIDRSLREAEIDGLVERVSPACWRPTATGFRFLNDLQARFLSD